MKLTERLHLARKAFPELPAHYVHLRELPTGEKQVIFYSEHGLQVLKQANTWNDLLKSLL